MDDIAAAMRASCPFNISKLVALIPFVLCCIMTAPTLGQDVDLSSHRLSSQDSPSRFFGRLGMVGAIYRPAVRVSNASGPIPDAGASLPSNVTMTVDLGFSATKHLDLDLMGGIPVHGTLNGSESLAPLGTLGRTPYGPAIATIQYHPRAWRRTQPYIGAGPAYALVLKDYDASIKNLKVHDNWGSVLQSGVTYDLTRRVGLFADFKEVWLSVNADGSIGIPARAHVQLNPALISIGLKYRF